MPETKTMTDTTAENALAQVIAKTREHTDLEPQALAELLLPDFKAAVALAIAEVQSEQLQGITTWRSERNR